MISKTISRSLAALMLVLLVSSFSYEAPAKKFSPVGSWDYSVVGVPVEYETGTMIIVEEGKTLGITLAINEYYKTEAESIEYKKKDLSFIVWVESQEISISGTFEGDKFSGMVSFSEGDFEMIATRKSE